MNAGPVRWFVVVVTLAGGSYLAACGESLDGTLPAEQQTVQLGLGAEALTVADEPRQRASRVWFAVDEPRSAALAAEPLETPQQAYEPPPEGWAPCSTDLVRDSAPADPPAMPDLSLRFDEGDVDAPPDAVFASAEPVPDDLQRLANEALRGLRSDVADHDARAAEKMAALLAVEEAYWAERDPAQFGRSPSAP